MKRFFNAIRKPGKAQTLVAPQETEENKLTKFKKEWSDVLENYINNEIPREEKNEGIAAQNPQEALDKALRAYRLQAVQFVNLAVDLVTIDGASTLADERDRDPYQLIHSIIDTMLEKNHKYTQNLNLLTPTKFPDGLELIVAKLEQSKVEHPKPSRKKTLSRIAE